MPWLDIVYDTLHRVVDIFFAMQKGGLERVEERPRTNVSSDKEAEEINKIEGKTQCMPDATANRVATTHCLQRRVLERVSRGAPATRIDANLE